MAQFHFVEDYEKHVASLTQQFPLDKAMSLAVGGSYEEMGAIQLGILKHTSLQPGASIFDLGCGSGRLACAIGKSGINVNYIGTDVVQALIDYAKTKSPPHFRFFLNRAISVPADPSSIDIACAFSVFTHLLHHETYLYLEAMHKALRQGGKVVFSFLEFESPAHWTVFENTFEELRRRQEATHLNTFIERNTIRCWAEHLGFEVDLFVNGFDSVEGCEPLGQSVAIMHKL